MRRRFRGLRDRAPDAAYDVVVIGAGVGGLVCATLLARQGMRVLLAEQHYMVGGLCSTFRRAGYTFDAATHFYPLLGNPETLTGRLLLDLGVETGWVKMDPVDTFHLPDGSRFSVAADFQPYLAALKRRFPEEASALDRFFDDVRRAYFHGLLLYFKGRRTNRLGELGRLTLREVIDRHLSDPKLKLILTADCPHWGSPPCRTSFVFDSMLRLSYFLGNYYPEQGSQAFADELALRFEEAGGHILMSSRVDRILVGAGVDGGRAQGVEVETTRGRLAGRRRVSADAVVSNADLLLTLEQLLGPEVVPASFLDEARELRPTYPCFLTHIGLEGVAREALERAQGYYWASWDSDTLGEGGLRCKIFSPTLYEPRMAPPGREIVILQKVMKLDYEAVIDWPAHKREVEDYVVGVLEEALPGIGERIVVKLSASAKTTYRFTLNTRGAMLGWEMSPDQLGVDRPGIDGPLPNLYFTGHWTRPGGGITPVIISALRVAEAITGSSLVSAPPGLDEALAAREMGRGAVP